MTTSAIVFMIFSMLLIWGGLLLAVLHLRKHPDIPMKELPDDTIY